jgi:hypothetical protein
VRGWIIGAAGVGGLVLAGDANDSQVPGPPAAAAGTANNVLRPFVNIHRMARFDRLRVRLACQFKLGPALRRSKSRLLPSVRKGNRCFFRPPEFT